MSLTCPLCASQQTDEYFQDRKRRYLQCHDCELVFVHPQDLPSQAREKQEYDLHQNTPDDEGYIRFLSRVATPLSSKLNSQSTGLDFGCGPSPVLANLLKQQGHSVSLYDPFYFPETDVLSKHYDFISSTEAIEHFHQPAKEWQIWLNCLKPGGWLAIMTKRVINKDRFANWHYKNDITHVSFFSEATFAFLAHRDGLSVEFVGTDVVLMRKQT